MENIEKITEEELKSLQDLQQKGQDLILELGQIEFSKIMLDQRYTNAIDDLKILKKDEDNNLYQIIEEKNADKLNNIYCVYNNKKILNNRWDNYDPYTHKFK
jgi:hypothetical protein